MAWDLLILRVAIFTESWMVQRLDGSIYAVRDSFPKFAAALADTDTKVTLVARTIDETPELMSSAPDLLQLGDQLRFLATPFYKDALDGYRRLPNLWRKAAPAYAQALEGADVALLRVRHQAAPFICRMARRRSVPLGLWWAAPVLANIGQNYSATSTKGRFARLVGSVEEAMLGRLARQVAANFILDAPMFEVAGRPSNAYWPVPNLVSRAHFVDAPAPRRVDRFTFAFAGRLVRHKGIFDMLAAFGQLAAADPRLHLNVAGTGPDAEAFAREASAHPQAGQITLLGHLGLSGVQEMLREAEVFVLPSYAEGLPKVMWEAWGAGCSIIITDVGGVTRFAKDGQNALVTKPGDIEALATAMSRLIADEDLRQKVARAGLAVAKDHAMENELARLRVMLTEIACSAKSILDVEV